jgi:hypothetical protein
MHEDLKRRILDLLFMLHLREDGSLPMAAIALEREAGGPEFERDKSMLLQGGAIALADIPPGMVDAEVAEVYVVTAAGRQRLRDAGYIS